MSRNKKKGEAMKNTEQFCVWEIGTDLVENRHCNFKGSYREARAYAIEHGYGGGLALVKKVNGKVVFETV